MYLVFAAFQERKSKEMLAISYLVLQACVSHFCGVSDKSGALLFLPCSHKDAVAHLILAFRYSLLGGRGNIPWSAPSKTTFGGFRKWDWSGQCPFPLRTLTWRGRTGGEKHIIGGAQNNFWGGSYGMFSPPLSFPPPLFCRSDKSYRGRVQISKVSMPLGPNAQMFEGQLWGELGPSGSQYVLTFPYPGLRNLTSDSKRKSSWFVQIARCLC